MLEQGRLLSRDAAAAKAAAFWDSANRHLARVIAPTGERRVIERRHDEEARVYLVDRLNTSVATGNTAVFLRMLYEYPGLLPALLQVEADLALPRDGSERPVLSWEVLAHYQRFCQANLTG